MTYENGPQPESRTPFPDKILKLHEVLEADNIPHAFGGALAADYYRIPRGTIDVDVAIFLQPEEQSKVIYAIGSAFTIPNADELTKSINEHEQGLTHWGQTRVDLFFSTLDFHKSVAERVQRVPFNDTDIPIISAEDIIIFKTLYGRGQDWTDIEAISELQRQELDINYMTRWLGQLVGPEDSRISRLENIVVRETPTGS